jgi:hypothetical protein
MGKYDNLSDDELKKVIKQQKTLIKRTGFDPTWELFSASFGWFQIQKEMSKENQEKYKKMWG